MRKMKKALAVLLAATMTLSMGMTAFAEPGAGDDDGGATTTTSVAASDEQTIELFTKTYKGIGNDNAATFPNETLKFTVEQKDTNPANAPDITIGENGTETDPNLHLVTTVDGKVKVTIPSYDKVGKYNYTVKEVQGNTQGVTYTAAQGAGFDVQVFAKYNDEHTKIVTECKITSKDATTGNKIQGIENKYALGSLKVTKMVEGNLASQDVGFTVNVKLTADNPVRSDISYKKNYNDNDFSYIYNVESSENGQDIKKWTFEDGKYVVTVPVVVKHNSSVVFNNIPAGVTYEVEEDSKHIKVDGATSIDTVDTLKDYEVSYTGKTGTITESTDSIDVTVTNKKGSTVDTGIVLDNAPYILLLALAAVGMFAFVSKKRSMEF